MHDLNAVASNFLKAYKEHRKSAYVEEKIEPEPIEITSLVILKQADNPPYFYGFKPSGRPIFTYDHKIAKVFNSGCPSVTEHIERLRMIGIEIEAHLTIWREGRTA